MIRCQARIKKERKRGLHHAVWPQRAGNYDKNGLLQLVDVPEHLELPECGGEIKLSFDVHIDGGCSCCGSTEVGISFQCSKCDLPFLPQRITNQLANDWRCREFIEKAINDYVERHQESEGNPQG